MNIVLWILQVLLALHTVMGAVWKLSNSEQAVASLSALPHGVWLALAVLEVLSSVGLVYPAFRRGLLWPVVAGAGFIAFEMLLFCGVHLASGDSSSGPMFYWLVVATISVIIGYGRVRLRAAR